MIKKVQKKMPFRKGHVYCVKVNQHLIREGELKVHYFPFDRSYIVHKDDEHFLRRVFRYYMLMDLTPEILDMLNRLYVDNESRVGIYRNDEELTGYSPRKKERFPELDNEEWLLIVPTHVTPQTRKKRKKPDHSSIGYLMSKVIGETQNQDIRLPPISVQTPDRRIPLLCSICMKLPSYYDGKCQPGTAQCRSNSKTRIPLDLSRKYDAEASVEEAGDALCP